jgi:hypothetical protein
MALTACQSDDEQGFVSQFPEDGVMRFTTNLVDPAAALTRASITGNDLNQQGQQFQVKVVNDASATYSYFTTLTYNSTEWLPQTTMLWQNDQQAITVTAAYKQGKTFTDDEFTGITDLTVAADQSSQAKLNAQDLLTMPTKNINPATEQTLLQGGKLVINFYHALSKLDVTLELKDQFFRSSLNTANITDVKISGTNLSYNFKAMETTNENYGTVTAAATPVTGDILPMKGNTTDGTAESMQSTATYEAILVPQQIAAGALTVSFKVGTRSFSWTNTQAYTLEQGKQYTLPLTVGYNTVTAPARAFTASNWEDGTGSNLATE